VAIIPDQADNKKGCPNSFGTPGRNERIMIVVLGDISKLLLFLDGEPMKSDMALWRYQRYLEHT